MLSLATKYRPQTFEDVCSQDSIIKILERQLELNQIKNCYLFCGASGCGKTTIARIFANKINKNQGTPIEIDGASNNGVDNVKQIVSDSLLRSIDSKYKVYIIDECHALTSQAWQAFLKCIEEPPEFTIFIFCTTDPQKIPSTILNRVMRFNFSRMTCDVIKSRLEYICEKEQFVNYVESCDYISRLSQGCMRDAISMLDKAASYNNDLNIENVLEALGGFSYDIMFDLLNALIDCNENKSIEIIEQIFNDGKDMQLFIHQFISFCLDVNKYLIFNNIQTTSIPYILEDKLKYSINFKNANQYYSYLINKLLDCKNSIKNEINSKSIIEIYCLNICRLI